MVAEGADPLPGSAAARVLVPSSREALARLADAYHGHPSRRLTVVGITGTNGKTTTSLLVEALLGAGGRPTGVIGTIQYRVGGPGRGREPDHARGARAAGAPRAHGGAREWAARRWRCRPTRSRSRAWTASSSTWPSSPTSPRTISTSTRRSRPTATRRPGCSACSRGSRKPRRAAVVNVDDPAGAAMVRAAAADPRVRILTFGLRAPAELRPTRWQSGMDGIRLEIATPGGAIEIRSALVGEHNVMNLLGGGGRRPALEMAPRGRSAGSSPGSRPSRAASSAWRPASRSWWWSTTPTPRTRSRTCSTTARQAARARRAARRGVRLRRRPRPRQAPDHGRHRGAAGRPGVGHLRQPAQRAAGGHPGRDRRPASPRPRRAATSRSRTGARAIEGAVAWAPRGRRGGDRGQGSRDLPDRRVGGAAVRRPRGGPRRAGRARRTGGRAWRA